MKQSVKDIFKEGLKNKIGKDKRFLNSLIESLIDLIIEYKNGDFVEKTFEILLGIRHEGESEFFSSIINAKINLKYIADLKQKNQT